MSDTRGTRVYVGNLTEKVKKEDLEGEFTKYGKLNSVWVAFNPPGFAFVEFENRNDAEKACDIMNGSEILGSQLRVEISKGRPRQGRRGGRDFTRRPASGFSGIRSGGGGFRPSRGSGSRYNQDANYNTGSRRGYNGGRDGSGSVDINRRDGYANNRDIGRTYSAGFGSSTRNGGNQHGGNRFRSRSPVGSRRF